jgi:hypothetical protein
MSGEVNIVKIEVKDADKILQAASQEAMKWFDKLVKTTPGKLRSYRLYGNPKWEFVKVGTMLDVVIDKIDDSAEARFNERTLNFGDGGNPIKDTVKVKPGPNVLAVAIRNTGGFRWGAHIRLKERAMPEHFFNKPFTYDDPFVPGQGYNVHVLLLSFEGR